MALIWIVLNLYDQLPVSDVISVHGKEKYAVGPMDQLLRKAAGPQQKLPVHSLHVD